MTEARHPEAIQRTTLIVGGLCLLGLLGGGIALAFLSENEPLPEVVIGPPPVPSERAVAPPPAREPVPAAQTGMHSTTFTGIIKEVTGRSDVRVGRPCTVEAQSSGPEDDMALSDLTIRCGSVELFRRSKLSGRRDSETFKLVKKGSERYPSYTTAPTGDGDTGETVAIDPFDYVVLVTTNGPTPSSVKLDFSPPPTPTGAARPTDRPWAVREVR